MVEIQNAILFLLSPLFFASIGYYYLVFRDLSKADLPPLILILGWLATFYGVMVRARIMVLFVIFTSLLAGYGIRAVIGEVLGWSPPLNSSEERETDQ